MDESAPVSRKRKLLRRSFGLFRDRTTPERREQPPPQNGDATNLRHKDQQKAAAQCTDTPVCSSKDSDSQDVLLNPVEEDGLNSDVFMQTQVLTVQQKGQERSHDVSAQPIVQDSRFCSGATTMLQDLLCGPSEVAEEARLHNQHRISDDPTIQESIECVFPSNALEFEEDGDDGELIAPSMLQQSLLRSRSNSKLSTPMPRRRRVRNNLVQGGTVETTQPDTCSPCKMEEDSDRFSPGTRHCTCHDQRRPVLDPNRWPQRPLLFRPTPGSGTRIKGIRFSGSSDYIWEAQNSTVTWPSALKAHWGQPEGGEESSNPMDVMCSECMVLPINNGNEKPGESLVVDFASDIFEGTILLRLRHTEGTTPNPYDDSRGYFVGMNRRYQAVLRGRFKESIQMTECVTGLQLDRRCGKLPPKWIVKSAIKLIGFFAPQLDANLYGDRPHSLTPLGSTPQCVIVEDEGVERELDGPHEEPSEASKTLIGKSAGEGASSMQRARYRKKSFDRLFCQKNPFPRADTSKLYTFEFLQHLFNFQEFSIELGSMLGSIHLKDLLDGQPMPMMAMYGGRKLWSFDMWHESLYEDALTHDKLDRANNVG